MVAVSLGAASRATRIGKIGDKIGDGEQFKIGDGEQFHRNFPNLMKAPVVGLKITGRLQTKSFPPFLTGAG
jgi:hypothetical protein